MISSILMLEAIDVSISYGEKSVLQHFSCRIKQGEMVCIAGKSGCGKTSLLRSFIGFTPFEGTIRVAGKALTVHNCERLRSTMAYLPQELSFPTEFMHEAVAQITQLRRDLSERRRQALLAEYMDCLAVEHDLLQHRMGEISGGQRQRIMLAAISLLGRDIWLLDEPTAALDAASRNAVLDFLQRHQASGTTILVVSHDAGFAARCTRTLYLD